MHSTYSLLIIFHLCILPGAIAPLGFQDFIMWTMFSPHSGTLKLLIWCLKCVSPGAHRKVYRPCLRNIHLKLSTEVISGTICNMSIQREDISTHCGFSSCREANNSLCDLQLSTSKFFLMNKGVHVLENSSLVKEIRFVSVRQKWPILYQITLLFRRPEFQRYKNFSKSQAPT